MTGASLQLRLTRLFLLTGVVTAVLALATVLSLVQLSRATHDRVDVYGPALLGTETLAGAFSDQETGLRGFLAGGRDTFLLPYADGKAAERHALAQLRRLLTDRPDILRRMARVESAGRQWRRAVATPAIAAVRADGPSQRSFSQAEAGRARFDQIRVELARLRAPVLAEQVTSGAELTRSQHRLDVILAVALVGLLLLVGVAFWALRRWVTRPLGRLGTEVDQVEAGDLAHRVDVTGAPQEILVLAGQVDRMRARVVANASLAERARAEATGARALVEAQAEDLRRSNTELEQFAYVASHDLQEPLRKVASFCQLLERRYKGQLDERGEQYIEFAVDGAKRMQQLIQDLLMFSRVGRHSSGFRETDLEQVLDQSVRQLDSALEESGAEVTHDPLPTVEADPSLLAQLFQNLIGNSVKFRGDTPPRVHVSASPSSTAGVWEFACSDNGIGVEAQYADKIFVIFQRLHGRDAYSGTGIGLAMCKKIVEHHGGRLWLDTSPRDTPGAVFRWTLPERQADTGLPGEPAAPTDKKETTSHDSTVRG
ncbi:MAG: CHASE3 domain-containing protein [Sporichthyaceae bacterium]